MTTAPYQRLRGGSLAFDDQAARIARPVVGSHTMLVANAANGALLDGPAGHGAIYEASAASATTWSLSYVRSAQARYLEVRATLVSTSISGTVRIKFTATDAAGNTVSHTSSAVPDGYRDNTTTVYPPAGSSVWEMARGLSGFIDLDALAATLVNASWSLNFEITTSSAVILSLHVVELPRWRVDDTATAGGVIPGSYQRGRWITDGAQDGLNRALATIEAARTTQRTYLTLAWPQDTAVAIPQTASTSYAALTNLVEGATYIVWRVRARRLYAASSAGESIRFRVLYKLVRVAAETADVRLSTGATASPFALTGLASTSWAWSSWKDAYLKTNGTDTEDTIGLEAKVSAGTATLYIAGIHVLEQAT